MAVRPLTAVVAAVAALLVAAGDASPHVEGPEHLDVESGAPRYVWVATGETPRGEYLHPGANWPRYLETMLEQVDVYCHAFAGDGTTPEANRDAAYLLGNNIFVALTRAMAEAVDPITGRKGAPLVFIGSTFYEPEDRSILRYGRIRVMSFGLVFPVPDKILPVVSGVPTGTYDGPTALVNEVRQKGEIEYGDGTVETVLDEG